MPNCSTCKYGARWTMEPPCNACNNYSQYEPMSILFADNTPYRVPVVSTSTTYTYTNDRKQIDIETTKYYQLGNGALVPKKVIFNPPATIVIWEDGEKTVVKCMKGDDYDAEKGLALCFMKKACNFYKLSYTKTLQEAKDWEKKLIPASILEEDDFVARMFKTIEKWERERYENGRTERDHDSPDILG